MTRFFICSPYITKRPLNVHRHSPSTRWSQRAAQTDASRSSGTSLWPGRSPRSSPSGPRGGRCLGGGGVKETKETLRRLFPKRVSSYPFNASRNLSDLNHRSEKRLRGTFLEPCSERLKPDLYPVYFIH